jgi:hypothetical protein
MFKVKWGAGGEAESWIHAYDTVGCPLALLEYVARDNYERIRLPSGLRIEVCLCQKNTSERERERERERGSVVSFDMVRSQHLISVHGIALVCWLHAPEILIRRTSRPT